MKNIDKEINKPWHGAALVAACRREGGSIALSKAREILHVPRSEARQILKNLTEGSGLLVCFKGQKAGIILEGNR